MKSGKHRRKKRIKILLFVILYELIAVMYCCSGILITSIDHIIDRRTAAVTDSLSVAVYDPAPAVEDGIEAYNIAWEEAHRWKGPVLSRSRGSVQGPSGKETYYNLNMAGVVSIMRSMGNTDEYWVREDGCKMLGDYIMVAANLNLRPRGSIVETSLGQAIVCDTGGFAKKNPTQIDIAVTW
ncbi:MAG: hypothetical protein IKE85_09395 [Mogibacterium sp.]|nr:hypothetical protein [Mogibacterium sp.]MBR2541017.1 hypothetical protein [Mogibacterium sp.]